MLFNPEQSKSLMFFKPKWDRKPMVFKTICTINFNTWLPVYKADIHKAGTMPK